MLGAPEVFGRPGPVGLLGLVGSAGLAGRSVGTVGSLGTRLRRALGRSVGTVGSLGAVVAPGASGRAVGTVRSSGEVGPPGAVKVPGMVEPGTAAPGAAGQWGQRGTGLPRASSTSSVAAVRSGCPGPVNAKRTGV